MAITTDDLLFVLSGGNGNTNPAAALGGVISSATGATGSITKTKTFNSLFDDISGAEAAAGDIEYRCIYVLNHHATLSGTVMKIWIDTNTTANEIDIGLDLGGDNATADTIADESTAPDPAVTFSHACTSYATGLNIGTLAAGHKYGIWIRRTIGAGKSATADDTLIFKVECDTAA